MAAPTWLPYATLGVSAIAAGGASWAAIITRRFNRAEGERIRAFDNAEAARNRQSTQAQAELSRIEARADAHDAWERDRVTEHYLELLRATHDFSICYVERVIPIYVSTPVGDCNVAWQELNSSHGRLLKRLSEAFVVARASVRPQLSLLIDIDVTVMVPFARPHGAPPLALQRAEDEHRLVAERLRDLILAMRADLGLASSNEVEHLDTAVRSATRKEARSLAHTSDLAELRIVLEQFQVQPLEGARADFLIDGSALSVYQMPLPGLRRPVAAILLIHGELLAAGLADDLDASAEVAIVQAIVRYIESGLRDGPGQRDTPNGGRITAWFKPSGASLPG